MNRTKRDESYPEIPFNDNLMMIEDIIWGPYSQFKLIQYIFSYFIHFQLPRGPLEPHYGPRGFGGHGTPKLLRNTAGEINKYLPNIECKDIGLLQDCL